MEYLDIELAAELVSAETLRGERAKRAAQLAVLPSTAWKDKAIKRQQLHSDENRELAEDILLLVSP